MIAQSSQRQQSTPAASPPFHLRTPGQKAVAKPSSTHPFSLRLHRRLSPLANSSTPGGVVARRRPNPRRSQRPNQRARCDREPPPPSSCRAFLVATPIRSSSRPPCSPSSRPAPSSRSAPAAHSLPTSLIPCVPVPLCVVQFCVLLVPRC
jgi:hypothetical protein